MGIDFEYIYGQTPLEEEEKEGLLIPSISNRGQLDEFEQLNIENALIWISKTRISVEKILSEEFIRLLHKNMYGDVWDWAGTFRTTNKNIGVDKWQITVELRKLIDDTMYWIQNKTFSNDEIAIRFKHRLVSIHCFPNGNGRHSRIIADIIIQKGFKGNVFSWGSTNLVLNSDYRKMYIEAVRTADRGNYEPLLRFARS